MTDRHGSQERPSVREGRPPRTESKVRKAEKERAWLRRALESTPAGSILVDARGTIVFANRLAESMFGYERDELEGRSVDVLVPAPYREDHPRLREAYQRRPESRAMGAGRDLHGLRKDGRKFPVEIGLSPIPTSEETLVLSIVIDISERVRARRELEEKAEELRRSNEELDRFAHVASHDLKAPLRAIRHLATWIEEDAGEVLPPSAAEHLETLQGRVDRLDRLLDDLLKYSRAGRFQGAVVEDVDTGQLVREAAELTGPPEAFTIEIGDLPVLQTPRAALEQVFMNLIQNAVKHHDEDHGHILIDAAVTGDWVEFQVEDDGPGIPEAYRERVFGMFQTLRPRDEVEGSGMGLAITKRSVEAWGGSIRIEESENGGCRFVFRWPLEMGAGEDA